MSEGRALILLCVGFIFGCGMVGLMYTNGWTVESRKAQAMQAEALARGYVEWVVVDTETGETELQWKDRVK